VEKVRGEDNPADLLTKNVGAELIARHCKKIGVERLNSRANTAPQLAMAQAIARNLRRTRLEHASRFVRKSCSGESLQTALAKPKVM